MRANDSHPPLRWKQSDDTVKQEMSGVQFLANPDCARGPLTSTEAGIVSRESAARALSEFRTWPGYGMSPLRDLPTLAERLKIGSLICKDESRRFGLGSFKALGGAYAVRRALDRRPDSLWPPVVCCATDGNHGRAVAFAARRDGRRCVVFVHEQALESKISAMRELGAEIVRVAGNYDDSVDRAKEAAAAEGWLLISDTSDDPTDLIAAETMQGYAIIVLETIEQLAGQLPTHVFVQSGVGGLAAAIAGCFADIAGTERPAIIVVEPENAACVMASARHRGPVRLAGDLSTNMAMLSCGEVSAPAWEILKRRADAFMSISDDMAEQALGLLAEIDDIPGGFAVSASAVAGLAGAIAAITAPEIVSRLAFTKHSRVLFIATEGVEPHRIGE